MIRWYSLLRGNVAEHSFLVVIVAAHSLVSFSSSFSQTSSLRLKLQMNGGFFNKLLVMASRQQLQRSRLARLSLLIHTLTLTSEWRVIRAELVGASIKFAYDCLKFLEIS